MLMFACVVGLTACQPAVMFTPVATLDPACDQSGVVVSDEAPSAANLLPIRMQVYLPPCYVSQPERSYPVFYLLHARGSSYTSWNANGAFEVADRLIREGRLPPFLLVTPGLVEGDRQVNFMLEDVLPYVESRYRVIGDRQHRAIGGGSLGAVFSARFALQHPDLVSSVACFGGAAVNGEQEVLRGWIAAIPHDQRPRLLVDIGQEDTMLFSGQILLDLLDEFDYPFRFNSEPGGHTYLYWVGNLDDFAFEWIAEDWR